jgi:hypothetical protein
MTTETRKRRNYTEDFKRDAVALVTEQGYKPSEAARSLGIGDNLIRRWKREFESEASGDGGLNTYIYALSNPINRYDSDGLSTLIIPRPVPWVDPIIRPMPWDPVFPIPMPNEDGKHETV